MIVALTGTPGTGKSSVAEQLEGFDTLDLTGFVKDRGLGIEEEEFEVDVDAMVEALEEELERRRDVVIEGHLSHHFPADVCVVLRTRPDVLRERLEQRGYDTEKIEENVEAEALDAVLTEAVESQETVIEIDTTGKTPVETAEELEGKVEKGISDYGSIDWSDYLVE